MADDKDKKSKHGFFFVKGIFDPQEFVAEKFDKDDSKLEKELKAHLKKIKDGSGKFCEVVWNKEGPADGTQWIFTCSDTDKCADKDSFCDLKIVYREGASKTLTIVSGKSGSATAKPKEFIDNVLFIYCECTEEDKSKK